MDLERMTTGRGKRLMIAAAAASLFGFAFALPATLVRAGTGTVHPGPL